MSSVFQKELRQYFHAVSGYVFLAIFLFFCGYYFVLGNLFSQNGDIGTFFLSILMVVMFLLPLITMRAFAEERKLRTDQLLFTSPVGISGVVWGKLLASLAFFCIGLAVTLSYVGILACFGRFEPLAVLGNYFGMVLAAAAVIAIGIFLSSLTENQIVAAVLTYCVCLSLWLVDFLGGYVKGDGLRALVAYCSFRNHFRELSMGIFSLSSVVYYLSITLLFQYLTVQVLEKKRWS
ncbi:MULTISPECIES: ABC transporter permease [Anaerotruncus]|jgi:ABC-2 type transport system permease protein|uniref:ABC transporter permease n=1 Tax=Anaerotruncus TaxID=244127 RepID=UPI00082BD0B1|nr:MULTISPECIES: ABC transporter permease [Anaerotruncus]RGX54087.1 ABC transporter [Anaerotruncus sp. AF02-27]